MNQDESDSTLSEPAPLDLPTGKPIERARLAAVVFTDVVGYSARMGSDEAGTIAAVHADFARMREACTEHGGEVLNTMGDGMMLCFGSAVEAVKFALKVQSEFGLRNAALQSGGGLTHRVGIHIGDVYRVEGGHVAGDGVNIAARLESRAPKGGICVSQIVYDTVKGKVSMRAEFMGPQTFKNIAEPLRVWRLAAEGAAKAAPAPVRVLEAEPSALRRWLPTIVTILVVLIALEMAWPYRDKVIPPDALLKLELVLEGLVRDWNELRRMVSALFQ